MTTASRPTFDTAKGGQKDLSALSKQYSSRDLPGHTKLKYREPGQGTNEDIKGRDFRRDLEERERVAAREKEKSGYRTDRDRIRAIESAQASKRPRQEALQSNLDADDAGENDSDSSDSDEDDTAELMAELARIKSERAAEAAKKEEQQRQREEQIRIENIIQGNPLLQYTGGAAEAAPKADMRVKRRWDDDVVFKNCSRSEPDKKVKIFINDSLRSDFHRKFMEKYIK